MFCEIYVQSAAHITTIHDLFIYFIFKFFLKPILDPLFSITNPRSSILDPYFPVNLEVLLIKIIVFWTTEVITCSKVINAFKQ